MLITILCFPTGGGVIMRNRSTLQRFARRRHRTGYDISDRPPIAGVFNLWSADPRGSAGSFQGVRGPPQKNWRPVAF